MATPTPDERQAVRAAFVRWAALQRGAPRDVESLITDVAVSHEHVGLLETDVHGQRVVWKSVPSASRARVTSPAITTERIDAWTVDGPSLRQRSDHIAVCDACGGEKKVSCAACGGMGRTICGACRGQRQAYGYAANGSYRLLNCTTCRGKGELDCVHCRRGVAVCAACAGEGRVQRWIELESWRRSTSNAHPAAIAQSDGDVIVDITRAHALTPTDLGAVPSQWLTTLGTPMQYGERVMQQRLRITRVPTYTVHYRLGGQEDRALFHGRGLAPVATHTTAFSRRASRLGSLAGLLLVIAIMAAILSLGRGMFYWSLPTLVSLTAFLATLAAIYGAAGDWTAARHTTRGWLIAAASFLFIAIVAAIVAMPRLSHAQRLIADGDLEDAEAELHALGDDTNALAWADLRLNRIRRANDVRTAREMLAKIPAALPQRSAAIAAVDRLILIAAANDIRAQRWSPAADTLTMLSEGARGQSDSALLLTELRSAADHAAAEAKREDDPAERLRKRLATEKMYVAWEKASGQWGTPPLIELRTAIAKDIDILE